ncbi:MAG: hypothetical protein JWM16_729 [Verrucomicrobiales bacterium]|nr:hypothetical protein [Verrucomicrobiales bacterium]
MRLSKVNAVLLAANLVMLGSAAYLFYSRPWAAQGSSTDEQNGSEMVNAKETRPATAKVVKTEIVTVTNQLTWAQLESEDYRAYIQRLRSIGCPEQTIRDIIIADLDKLIAPRVQSIYGRRKNLQYWQPEEEELANNSNQSELKRKERALDREKREIIQELLGVDLVRERMKQLGQEDFYERRLTFLPEDKRGQVRQVLDKYDDLEQNVRQKEWEGGEPLSSEDAAKLKKMRDEREAEITKLLSPEERTQYELWLSPTANAVRHSVYGMEATEEEFQKIYNIRKGFDQQWANVDATAMDDATRQKFEKARQETDEQVQQALGEKRYKDYKRGDDDEFHHLNAVVSKYNLPRETANEVYEVKRAAIDMHKAVEVDGKLTPEQRQIALKAIAQETDRTLKQLLGEKAFQNYVRRGQGQWIAQ